MAKLTIEVVALDRKAAVLTALDTLRFVLAQDMQCAWYQIPGLANARAIATFDDRARVDDLCTRCGAPESEHTGEDKLCPKEHRGFGRGFEQVRPYCAKCQSQVWPLFAGLCQSCYEESKLPRSTKE